MGEKAWYMFITILEQKAEEHGRTIVYIAQCYFSNKTFNKYGHKIGLGTIRIGLKLKNILLMNYF